MAREALSEILQDWMMEREWRFSQVAAPDITILANTTTYDLPTGYLKPFDAYLVSTGVKIGYVDPSIAVRYNQPHITQPLYTLVNSEVTGQIELVGTYSAGDTIKLRYYRTIPDSGQDDEQIVIPNRYVPTLLAGAREIMAAEKGDPGLNYWAAKYASRFERIKADDQRLPDEELEFNAASMITDPPDIWWPS